jgi:proline iminopeptidase
LRAGIGGSRLVVFERSGHFPWIEEPEHFFREVTRFLGNG